MFDGQERGVGAASDVLVNNAGIKAKLSKLTDAGRRHHFDRRLQRT